MEIEGFQRLTMADTLELLTDEDLDYLADYIFIQVFFLVCRPTGNIRFTDFTILCNRLLHQVFNVELQLSICFILQQGVRSRSRKS